MKIIMMRTADLWPYKDNPRVNDDAVDYVAESIREFGFKNPIIIDSDNQIINGHTRWKAAKQLKLKEVPCIIADDLTEDQVRAFRLVDNKASEQATWDWAKLDSELLELSDVFDMSKFDFEMPEIDISRDDRPQAGSGDASDAFMDTEAEEDEDALNWASATQDKVENILNLGIAQFPGVGQYDIPEILPEYELPEVDAWIGFNYALSEKEPETKGLHFFLDDYQFERIWNNPNKYLEIVKRFKVVLAPDFSPYGDMPLATQLFNHYRKHWCAAFWQQNGVTVIPTIRASTDPRSQDFFLDGEPERGVVAFSTMWSSQYEEETREEFRQMVETLSPSHLLIYGKVTEYVEESGIPYTRVPSFGVVEPLDVNQYGSLFEAEAAIRGLDKERALIYENIADSPVAAFQGDEGSVAIPRDATNVRTNTLTHNHPNARHGGTFSPADIHVATTRDLPSMRAASKEGSYYLKAGRNARPMAFNERLARDFPKLEREMTKQANTIAQRRSKREITYKQAHAMTRQVVTGVIHRYYKDTAADYG